MTAIGLPWLEEPLQQALAGQRSHALLVQGASGVGQFEFALGLATGWLCEAAADVQRPCGQCASCRLVAARSHPDLLVLLPEILRPVLGWTVDDDEERAGSEKKKPSKEIKVEAVRQAVAFAQTTSARGRGKVVLVYPAERMNVISANTLLKTLEEPPGGARFVLGSGAADALLPTVRSRCQAVLLQLPERAAALAWLQGQGVKAADAGVLLDAAGGRPQEVLAWVGEGLEAALWKQLPALVQRGSAGPVAGWPVPRLLDALQKVAHDVLSAAAGAAPRYFPAGVVEPLAGGIDPRAVVRWLRELQRTARNAEHPWNAALLAESLVEQGRFALARHSVHSGA